MGLGEGIAKRSVGEKTGRVFVLKFLNKKLRSKLLPCSLSAERDWPLTLCNSRYYFFTHHYLHLNLMHIYINASLHQKMRGLACKTHIKK